MAWINIDPIVRKNIEALSDRVGIITLDPATAERLLENPGVNRVIKPSQVGRLVDHMLTGTFHDLTGAPVLLDHAGRLVGGQHRCLAVMESGAEVSLLVRWDQTPPEIAADSEGGIPWTAADIAAAGADHTIKNVHIRQSVAKMLSVVDRVGGIYGVKATAWVPGRIQVAEKITDPRLGVTAEWTANARNATGMLFVPAGLGAIHALITDAGVGEYETFFHQLATGEGLYSGDPALTLRNLLGSPAFAAVRDSWQTMYVIAKAWKAFSSGEKIQRLYTFNNNKDARSNNKPITIPGQKPFFG
jgi:hypothetical protein